MSTLPLRSLDVEVYANYFLICVVDDATGKSYDYGFFDGERFVDPDVKLTDLLAESCIVTFNGSRFDFPIVSAFLQGAKTEYLLDMANTIIGENLPAFMTEKRFRCPPAAVGEHIDVQASLPGRVSLKTYAARIHFETIQDLPFPPGSTLSGSQAMKTLDYCANDCRATLALYHHMSAEVDLRREMSDDYGMDLRCASDPRIAELALKKMIGPGHIDRDVPPIVPLPLTIPAWSEKFESEPMRAASELVRGTRLELSDEGKMVLPDELKVPVEFNGQKYAMGVGGLHSKSNKRVLIDTRKGGCLASWDIASMYPRSMILGGLYPRSVERARFGKVFNSLVERRLAAKAAGRHSEAAALKITINSAYGKLSDRFSAFYSPEASASVVFTGQLSLLYLIEMLELHANVKVIDANTDGVFVYADDEADMGRAQEVVTSWETETGYDMERDTWVWGGWRDTNTYIAKHVNGSVKRKGGASTESEWRNPKAKVISDAALAYIDEGIHPARTVGASTDIRDFLFVKNVTGGALDDDGREVGKVVRFFRGYNETSCLRRIANGNKVAESDSAVVANRLPLFDDVLPDLNRPVYVQAAWRLIGSLGAET